MSLIKKLAGETVIYGVSSILGRMIGLVLLPLYTGVFAEGEFGSYIEMYAYIAVFYIFFVWRFDTTYFRYGTEDSVEIKALETANNSVAIFAAIGAIVLFLSSNFIGPFLSLSPSNFYFIKLISGILFFDALSEISFAHLRLKHKAVRFATIRIINIVVNLGLNFLFLTTSLYNPEIGIGYILISNLIASLVSFILLSPTWSKIKWEIDRKLLGQMFTYATPLMFISLAGVLNELLDRLLLRHLLPYDTDTNEAQLGIYGAVYKFSILIALFTQAFRYAAEPFFFGNSKHKKSPELYAAIGKYFVIFGLFGFLFILFYVDYFADFLLTRKTYHEGLFVIPILILAQVFLGLYYNLAVWFKLTDKTKYGMWISLAGVAITIALNVYLIPRIGYLGSAWATLICYLFMTSASYLIGRKHYPLKYQVGRILFYFVFAIGLWQCAVFLLAQLNASWWIDDLIHVLFLAIYGFVVFRLEWREFGEIRQLA